MNDWFQLYGERWTNEIVPDAFSHPAKFARGLIRRIYEHAIEEGWLAEGDTVIDPFAGVALGGLDAMFHGLNWVGIELEDKFVVLGQGGECDGQTEWEEKTLYTFGGWYIRLRAEAKYWGTAAEYWNGDVEGAGYVDKESAAVRLDLILQQNERWPRQAYSIFHKEDGERTIKECIKPALCGRKEIHESHHIEGNIELWNRRYNRLPRWGTAVILQGDSRNLVDVLDGARAKGIVASPPYAVKVIRRRDIGKPGFKQGATQGNHAFDEYSTNPANLGNMREGDHVKACIISSPPWAGAQQVDNRKAPVLIHGSSWKKRQGDITPGQSPGQLAAMPEGDVVKACISSFDNRSNNGYNMAGGDENASQNNEPANKRDSQTLLGGSRIHQGNRSQDGSERECHQKASSRRGRQDQKLEGSQPPEIQDWTQDNPILEREESAEGFGREESQKDKRRKTLFVERRQGPQGVPQQSRKSGMRELQGEIEFGDSSQRPRSLQQRPQQSASSLCIMSSEPTHETVVESEESGQGTSEVKCANGMEEIKCCISSPPWENSCNTKDIDFWRKHIEDIGRNPETGGAQSLIGDYGDSRGQLGQEAGDTFWSAAKTILKQCHQVLAPGGVAIFVTKRFVRDKQIVEFSQQWAELCESVGFELIEWIKAWLVEERGTQYDLTGKAHTKTVKRFSFFRRLHAQKYPHLAIEWEDVLCFRKGGAIDDRERRLALRAAANRPTQGRRPPKKGKESK